MRPGKHFAWAYVEKVGDFCACLLCGKVYSARTGIYGIVPHLEQLHGLFAEVHEHPKRVAEILRHHGIGNLDKRRKEVRAQLQAGNMPTRPSSYMLSEGNRQRESFVWHYAERVNGVAHCLICGKQSRADRAASVLHRHLENYHGISKVLHFERPEKAAEMLKKQGVTDLDERRQYVRKQLVEPPSQPKPIACPVKNEPVPTSISSVSHGISTDSDDDSDAEVVEVVNCLQKKPKAAQSFVWTYFAKFASSKECLICGARLAATSPTSGEYHLRDRHDITRQRHELNRADVLRHLKENGIDLEANRRSAMEAEEIRLQRADVAPPSYRPPTPPDSPKKKDQKRARSGMGYWRYDDDDDDSTPVDEQRSDFAPPMQKRGRRSSELESVEKKASPTGVELATTPDTNTSDETEVVRLEKEIEEGMTLLKKLRAEMIALKFEEASFLNGGQASGRISASQKSDNRECCDVLRRENVASTQKEVAPVEPVTRHAHIGEFETP